VPAVMPRAGAWCISASMGAGGCHCPSRVRRGAGGHEREDARELLEDLADAAVARQALAEPGESIPWEQVRAEAGL
jgi:hypothetical protein